MFYIKINNRNICVTPDTLYTLLEKTTTYVEVLEYI